MGIVDFIIVILAIVVFVGCVSGILGTAVNMLIVFGNIKGDVKDSDLLFNRFNAVFTPSLLEDAGIAARKKMFFWVKVLLVSVSGALMLIAAAVFFGL